MKFLVISFLFFVTTIAFAGKAKVFSMNLHCGLGDWQNRMDTVTEEIIRLDPDVIGLQEVCYNKKMNMTDYIVAKLIDGGYPVKFWKTTDTHQSFLKYQEQLLIITKHEVSSDIIESLPSMKFFENGFIAIKIENTWFINTHLHFALPQIRSKQYARISDVFSSKKAILMGDLNSNPLDKESLVMKKNKWSSFYNGPTYPSHKPEKTFDGFWTSNSLSSQIRQSDMRILFAGLDDQPSDHLGIWLEMELSE